MLGRPSTRCTAADRDATFCHVVGAGFLLLSLVFATSWLLTGHRHMGSYEKDPTDGVVIPDAFNLTKSACTVTQSELRQFTCGTSGGAKRCAVLHVQVATTLLGTLDDLFLKNDITSWSKGHVDEVYNNADVFYRYRTVGQKMQCLCWQASTNTTTTGSNGTRGDRNSDDNDDVTGSWHFDVYDQATVGWTLDLLPGFLVACVLGLMCCVSACCFRRYCNDKRRDINSDNPDNEEVDIPYHSTTAYN